MSKKLIIVLVVVGLALAAGGFFVFQQIQEAQKRQAYLASPDKPADELIAAVVAKDVPRAMNLFSAGLRAGYSEAYWKDTIFTELKDYQGTPARHAKNAVQATPAAPSSYDPQLNQQATRYAYDFSNVHNATYRLTFVVFRENNSWKVNELSGSYLP